MQHTTRPSAFSGARKCEHTATHCTTQENVITLQHNAAHCNTPLVCRHFLEEKNHILKIHGLQLL